MPAQMLIIGKVVSVEPKPESPLRRIVIVRPELDVTRVSELTLRWLADTQVPGTTGSGRGGAVP
jgi:cell shape-determining protein MreC